jgi:hypothetical protein
VAEEITEEKKPEGMLFVPLGLYLHQARWQQTEGVAE